MKFYVGEIFRIWENSIRNLVLGKFFKIGKIIQEI